MKKIQVLFSPLNADELYFTGKTTVVIDVLRATTSIVTALGNGAKEIIPVNTITFAMKSAGDLFSSHTLIAGERNTKKLDEFHLGNSPLEFTEENIKGKSIILYTTNGSKSIIKAKYSEKLYVVSFLNLTRVAKKLAELGNDIHILCSGDNGMFSLEDTICAGYLADKILSIDNSFELTDSAKSSIILSKNIENNIESVLLNSEHGKKLIENGFEKDVKYSSQLDFFDILPKYSEGSIKAEN